LRNTKNGFDELLMALDSAFAGPTNPNAEIEDAISAMTTSSAPTGPRRRSIAERTGTTVR